MHFLASFFVVAAVLLPVQGPNAQGYPSKPVRVIISFTTLYHPNDKLVWWTGAITLAALIWGIARHNVIASPKEAAVPESGEAAAAEPTDLDAVVAQARRDIG